MSFKEASTTAKLVTIFGVATLIGFSLCSVTGITADGNRFLQGVAAFSGGMCVLSFLGLICVGVFAALNGIVDRFRK